MLDPPSKGAAWADRGACPDIAFPVLNHLKYLCSLVSHHPPLTVPMTPPPSQKLRTWQVLKPS